MEIKRKKIKQAEIFQKEQAFANKISEICHERNKDFQALGYELELEFGQKENEHQAHFEVLSNDTDKKFESGYVSRAMITVKRLQTEEEQAESLRLESENRAVIEACEDATEAEQLQNDETLRNSETESKRSVAFTRVMLVRAYKAFWTEWICLGDDLDQLDADLNEFLEALTERQANGS